MIMIIIPSQIGKILRNDMVFYASLLLPLMRNQVLIMVHACSPCPSPDGWFGCMPAAAEPPAQRSLQIRNTPLLPSPSSPLPPRVHRR